MKEVKSFVFYHEWAKILEGQPDKVRLAVFDAIINYACAGELPRLDAVADMAFKFIKADIDRDKEKYDDVCDKRRKAISKRWKKDTKDTKDTNVYKCIQMNTNEYKCIQTHTNAYKRIQTHTNDTDNDNDDDNVDVDDNDDDNDTHRINTIVCANNKGTRARKLKEIVEKQQQEDEKARAFQIQLYQNDDARLTSFERPSEDEVYEYLHTYTLGTLNDMRGETLKFLDHYDANGWMMGTCPIRDWRAAVRNWISNMGKFIDNYNKQERLNEKGRQNFIAAIRDNHEQAEYERKYGKDELPF